MNTDVNNHQEIDDPKLAKIVNREMSVNKHEEYKVYKFDKQSSYLVAFRAKATHYLFYRY